MPVADQEGAQQVGTLVRRAADGDASAWEALVRRFEGLVWAVARGFGLGSADAADVSQTTWLRLVEHLGRIREPDRVGAWLATTARHECLRVLRYSGRQIPTSDDVEMVDEVELRRPEEAMVTAERDSSLWELFDRLSARCRLLLRLLVADPQLSYAEVSTTLGMPIGSIGPTRARCLDHLRRLAEGAGISHHLGDSS